MLKIRYTGTDTCSDIRKCLCCATILNRGDIGIERWRFSKVLSILFLATASIYFVHVEGTLHLGVSQRQEASSHLPFKEPFQIHPKLQNI